jgi:hemolysin activation/secretion protein
MSVKHRRQAPAASSIRRLSRPTVRATLAGLAVAISLYPLNAFAQAIERNLPPPPKETQPTIAPPIVVAGDQDATPLGPKLTGIVVLGGADPALATPAAGIDVSRAPRLADDRRALQRFLGRPLSKKLIAEIEAEIAGHYRDAGFPFVNLTTPEQDITSGVLQIRALKFRLGAKTAPGAKPKDAAYILSRVRVAAGDDIDANQLAQDLDWLNRYPFRHTDAQFTPGEAAGQTDLKLTTTTTQPWSAYVGYADSGSPLTGTDRYIAGLTAAIPGLRDAYASYQLTASNDALFDDNRIHEAAYPAYISDAGRLVIPTFARQDIEGSLNYVVTNQPTQSFIIHSTILEATLAYRGALSDLSPGTPGEAVVGIEAKRDDTQTLFGNTVVTGAGIDVFQATFGYTEQINDAWGRTALDLTLHVSPGGLNTANTDAAFLAFSKGRFTDARYAYIGGDLTRSTRLPKLFGLSGFTLNDTLIGQYAAAALPQTEQMGLGGQSLVRGYTLDDGAFDSAIISRNELRTPTFSMLSRMHLADQVAPYAFIDTGFGRDQYTGAVEHMASGGLAADYQLGRHLSATVDGAVAIEKAGLTPAGTIRLESRVTYTF